MCTENELKTIIIEEYDGLDKAVIKSGISEDLYVSSIAKSFYITLEHCKECSLNIKHSKSWVDRVYKRAVALRD